MNHTRMGLAALAVAVLATAGCGSSKQSSGTASSAQAPTSTGTQPAGHTETSASTSPAGPLTRAVMIQRADLICRRVNQTLASITIKKKSEFLTVLPRLADYEYAAVAEMRKLTPPASMTASWNQITEDAHTIAATTAAGAEHEKHGTLNETQALAAEAKKAKTQMIAIATREGLTDCAQA